MAVDLALKGFEVNMCEAPEFEEGIKKTLERQTIDLIDTWGDNQADYMKKGLSLEELGIAGLNVDELKQVLG